MAPSTRPLRILAYEPFDAGSHRHVRESITRHAQHEWRWCTRPGRAWKWRMRLAAVEFADAFGSDTPAGGDGTPDEAPPDVIFATSLLSVADLRALLPAPLRSVPMVLYMHENQAAYPEGRGADTTSRARDAHFALTNLTSIRAADLVLWNSEWNRRSFREGMGRLLRNAPDTTLKAAMTGRSASAEGRHELVVWPPVEPPPTVGRTSPGPARHGRPALHNPVRVVWPHRWEHDKGPDRLLAAAETLTERLDIRWTILGEQFRQVPPALERFRTQFGDRIDHMGFEPDRDAYWGHLSRCDWVLSTARHEFFGIAVTEALLAGCLPWLPARLSYPELLPANARGLSPECPPDDPDAVRTAIAAHLQPAVARNAVRRVEAAIEGLVAGR